MYISELGFLAYSKGSKCVTWSSIKVHSNITGNVIFSIVNIAFITSSHSANRNKMWYDEFQTCFVLIFLVLLQCFSGTWRILQRLMYLQYLHIAVRYNGFYFIYSLPNIFKASWTTKLKEWAKNSKDFCFGLDTCSFICCISQGLLCLPV